MKPTPQVTLQVAEQARLYLRNHVDELIETLVRIESRMAELDGWLDDLQPAQSGRLRVMWVSRVNEGWPSERYPTMVRWHRSVRSGQWTAKPVTTKWLSRRALSKGDFGRTSEQVTVVLELLGDLFEQYGKTRGRLSSYMMGWNLSRPHVTRALDDADRRIERLRTGVPD